MEDFNPDRILSVLEAEDHWLTFDELFSRVHHDCAWTDFAAHLERLVEQEKVLYVLPYGAYDVCPQRYILSTTSIGNGVIHIVQEKDSQSDPARPLRPADGGTEHWWKGGTRQVHR